MESQIANVPASLKASNQWLSHDQNKMPISATTGKRHDWQNNLASFEVAVAHAQQHGLGLGFAFNGQSEFFGIDLDGCVNPATGTIEQWAMMIVDAVQSYCEVSPSRTGLKLFCRGSYQGHLLKIVYGLCIHGNHQQQVEFKTDSGYFTVTGEQHPALQVRNIANVDPVAFYQWLDPGWQPIESSSIGEPGEYSTTIDQNELIARAQAYLLKTPSAISGQGGHDATFNAACILIHGFGLTVEQALPLLEKWNQNCSPPWSRDELLHKLNQANERDDGQGRSRGYLLNDSDIPIPQNVIDFCNLYFANNALARSNNGTIAKSTNRSFAGIDVSELSLHEYAEIDWLVDKIFSADQPVVFGAASKATKTTQLVDLSVALATATPWLSNFPVSKRRKVLFVTGESNNRAICKRIKKALSSRGLDWHDVTGCLRVEANEFPSLPSAADQAAIANDVNQWGFDVVIIDPLYRGLQKLDTHRVAEVGDAIISFVKSCSPASVIISHHVTKSSAKELKVPSLEDLSGAGLAESCGNWWLIGRNEEYQHNKIHDLTVTFGGRDEQSGIMRIVFNEQTWIWEVGSTDELNSQRILKREQQKQDAATQKQEFAKQEVVNLLDNETLPRPKWWIESRTTSANTNTRVAMAELLKEGILVERLYKDACNRDQRGLVLHSRSETQPMLVDVR